MIVLWGTQMVEILINRRKFIIVIVLFALVLQLAVIGIMFYEDKTTETVQGKYLKISNMSDSMGLSISYPDEAIGEKIKETDMLQEGNIYVYNSNNTYIIHRLIKCLDNDCNVTIFKGDNNKVGEIVNKSQIIYKVTAVVYP